MHGETIKVVYLYLSGGNEKNNEKLSTKIIDLRSEILVEDSHRYARFRDTFCFH